LTLFPVTQNLKCAGESFMTLSRQAKKLFSSHLDIYWLECNITLFYEKPLAVETISLAPLIS
jgi:hypothetical protein